MVLMMVIKVMHGIGIVPVYTEVRSCRLEPCKTPYGLIIIGISRRVGILGYAPYSLYAVIRAYELLHHVHVRSRLQHGHFYHLYAKILRDLEVSVISGNYTEELHRRQLAPGCGTHHSVGIAPAYEIVHHVKGGVAVDDDIVRIYLHDIRKELLALRYAFQVSIVAAVNAVLSGHIRLGAQYVHHAHGEIQLLRRGLSSGHIKAQGLILKFLVLLLKQSVLGIEFFLCHLTVLLHNLISSQNLYKYSTAKNPYQYSLKALSRTSAVRKSH